MINRTPSKNVFIITWLILILYLTIDFMNGADVLFFQLKYDWKKMIALKKYNDVVIDSISNDYLVFDNNLIAIDSLKPYYTFSIENDNKSFFRCSNIAISKEKIIFSGLKWINRKPKYSIKNVNFQIVNLPIIQSGNKTITTIGDSQIFWREGRDFRKNISKNKDLVFVGNDRDIYGYPYEGELYATCQDILNKLSSTSSTQNYVLFFGAHDKRTDQNTLSQNVCNIFSFLLNRNETEKIFAITLPASNNSDFNTYNELFNEILINCSQMSDKIKIVNLNKYLKDKEDYLLEDKVHLNKKGYDLLNGLLMKQIK